MIVEVCVSSIASLEKAKAAGADRVELCAALSIGGITPSFGLLQQAVNSALLPVHCLIRPREGHFTYTEKEANLIEDEIKRAKDSGCKGIVIGALTSDFTLDQTRLERWVQLASPLHLTFHRAFDVVADPEQALETLIALGFDTVLTAGQMEKAEQGIQNLTRLHDRYGKQITLMPGSGITTKNCSLFKEKGFRALHLSGNQPLSSIPIPKGVNPSLSFLHQELNESHLDTLRDVVAKVKT